MHDYYDSLGWRSLVADPFSALSYEPGTVKGDIVKKKTLMADSNDLFSPIFPSWGGATCIVHASTSYDTLYLVPYLFTPVIIIMYGIR